MHSRNLPCQCMSYGTCPLLLDGRHLVLSKVPVCCQSFPVSWFQQLVRQAPSHRIQLLVLTAAVKFERQCMLGANNLIKLRVSLKGQLNHVSRLIKATLSRQQRGTGRKFWQDTNTYD